MIKRILIVLAVAIAVVFIPYYVHELIIVRFTDFYSRESMFVRWWMGSTLLSGIICVVYVLARTVTVIYRYIVYGE